MSGLRIKAFSPESRMKRVAPSARKRVDLPAALAMKANNTIERYSLEERKQIAEILRVLSAKPQQWATDEPTADRIGVVDNEGCTIFEQNSDFCSV
jgi:ABC-type multidrug transport system ATPase subunit